MRDRIIEYDILVEKYRALVARYAIPDLTVNWHGGIQLCEAGAFVECTLFIPKEKLDECIFVKVIDDSEK